LNSLDKYILRQCLTPLAFILLVSTMLAWTTQSLQRVDILVEYGQGFGVFAYLSLLIIPSLLSVVIPFALFGASVYALYRLHSDSEIAVMFAAGVSRWRLAAPILLITLLGALFTLYVNADLTPRSYRILKRHVADIRADFASAVIRSGEFTTFTDSLTIYVDDARPGGQFVGLLIHDTRVPDEPKTYMAERAVLQESDQGPVLFLRRGNIQHVSADSKEPTIIPFDELALNVSKYRETAKRVRELSERYPLELLNPDMSDPYERLNVNKFKAEGHARFAGPLHAFAYVLVGLFAMIGGAYSRRGVAVRIAVAGGVILTLRVLAYAAQGFAETTGAYWMLYAVPGAAIAAASYLLFANASFELPRRAGDGVD